MSLLPDRSAGREGLSGRLQGVAWSYSRRQSLEQCPRRYYYEYYGANPHVALTEPAKETLLRLKGLSNRHLRVGELAHLAISTFYKRSHSGRPSDIAGLARWVVGLLRDDVRHSMSDPDGLRAVGTRFPPKLLREFHYREPRARELLADAERRLAAALSTFADADAFQALRRGGFLPGTLVETHTQLQDFPCAVAGKADLAYVDNGVATVVDWKTGMGDTTGDDSLQLAGYGLWAMARFGVGPEALRVVKAHLGDGTVVEFPVSERTAHRARARILQDAERMAAVHPYGISGRAAAFTGCAQPAVCAQCAFQRVCPDAEVV